MQSEIHYEGDAQKVFEEIFDFAKHGQDSGKRPVLIILGGILRGVYGGGGVIALNQANLTNGFHTVVGVSTGAPAAAYFLAGQAEIGTSIYYEECLTKKFINFWNIFFKRSIVDVDYLGKIWKGEVGNKKVDLEKLRNIKTKCLIAVSEFFRGNGELLEINKMENPICPVVASCSIPFLTASKVKCGDKYYTDGAMSLSFPVHEIVKKMNPTSILVFPNRDINYKDNIWVQIWERVVYYSSPDTIKKKFNFKDNDYRNELKFLRHSKIPHSIIWCDNQVSGFTKDKKMLIAAKDRYRDFVADLIGQFGPLA